VVRTQVECFKPLYFEKGCIRSLADKKRSGTHGVGKSIVRVRY
jgi:hypothetical protein